MQKVEPVDALARVVKLHQPVAESVHRGDALSVGRLDEEKNILVGPDHRLLDADVKVGGVIIYPHLAKVRARAVDGRDRFTDKVEHLSGDVAMAVVCRGGLDDWGMPGSKPGVAIRHLAIDHEPVEYLALGVESLDLELLAFDRDPCGVVLRPELLGAGKKPVK